MEGFAAGTNGSLLAKSTATQAMAAHPAVGKIGLGALLALLLPPQMPALPPVFQLRAAAALRN